MDQKKFKKEIWSYYRKNRRDLPWRNSNNPYKIFVSEIMLQQTQVVRVLKKYPEFIKAFPRFQSLANADLSDVLFVWRGMGYNRRARFLHQAAQSIVKQYEGVIPDSSSELQKLPGVGKGTAGSLVAFIYNKPVPFIETNIRRVFLHFFFNGVDHVDDSKILELVAETIDKRRPREWYYALMDYGSMLPRRERRNANVQSKTYKKQSPFKGSSREIRGQIISFLVTRRSGTLKNIIRSIKNDEQSVSRALCSLERDGLIKKIGKSYKIV